METSTDYNYTLACRITLATAKALNDLVASTGQPKASLVESALVDYIAKYHGGCETYNG